MGERTLECASFVNVFDAWVLFVCSVLTHFVRAWGFTAFRSYISTRGEWLHLNIILVIFTT